MFSRIKRRIRERKLQKLAREDTRIAISLDDFYKYQQDKMLRVFKMSKLEKPESSLNMVQSLRYVDNMTSIVLNCAEDVETLFNIVSFTILPGARMRDSMNLLESSIVLALSGNYTAAHSLLRLAYESLIVGGFYHVIAHNPKEMSSSIRNFKGSRQYQYPKPFGNMVEDILENLTPEESRFASFVLERKIEQGLRNHQSKLIPPGFSLMLFQICEFYSLITPKYKNKIRDVYSELSTHIHVMPNTAYDIKDWKEGVVFSAEKLQIFQSWFLIVLDLIGYLYNVILAGSYSWEDVASHSLDYMERFKMEGEKMILTNLIVSGLCNHTLNRD